MANLKQYLLYVTAIQIGLGYTCDGKTKFLRKGMVVCYMWDTYVSEIKQTQTMDVCVCVCVYVCVHAHASPHVQDLVDTICPICGFYHADNSRYAHPPPLQLQFNYPKKIIRGAELINSLGKWKQQ
jgi:hypothetical protein